MIIRDHIEVLLPGDKVEDQSKCDGNWESRQCSSEERQEDESETETDKDGDEAGQRGVPVTIAARLANQDRVEDEVAQSKLHPSVLLILLHLLP